MRLARAAWLAALAPTQASVSHVACDRRGDIAGKTELADDGGEERAVVALDPAHEVDLEHLPHRARRASLAQGFGGEPERRLQEFERRLTAEHVAELLAEADARRRRAPHGRGDQLGAAKLEKAAMADLMAARPNRARGSHRYC